MVLNLIISNTSQLKLVVCRVLLKVIAQRSGPNSTWSAPIILDARLSSTLDRTSKNPKLTVGSLQNAKTVNIREVAENLLGPGTVCLLGIGRNCRVVSNLRVARN